MISKILGPIKTAFNFSQYILSNMQKYPKNQVFKFLEHIFKK